MPLPYSVRRHATVRAPRGAEEVTDLSGIDVAVIAGGLGTRIAGVLGDTPKSFNAGDAHKFVALVGVGVTY